MNGQRCTAGSRLLVQRPLYERIVSDVAARARKIRVGDPTDPRTELGPLITEEHHARVLGYIESARAEGARVLAGGGRPAGLEQRQLPRGHRDRATSTRRCASSRRRSSGPCSCAMPFDDEADAIRLANATPTGSPRTSGRTTSAARTGSRMRSIPACAGSTRRTCATCARPFGGVKQLGHRPRGRRLRVRLLLRHRDRARRARLAHDPAAGAAATMPE